ncbi:MAG: hypothetical protein KA175_00780 [Flavobacteriales bacterium]|nr:hypothetical protein [Flavobacteriales bacterium]MBP6696117.1 hypothetical protein [Flavobacteriales bacterium]
MRPLLHRGRWPFAAFALTLAHLACFWGPVLRAPDAYMFNTDGDGLKNYFTVAWHVKHDTSLFQFAGMNHPFGEQIDYADAQPLLANTLHAIAVVLPALADHTVGVVNLFVVLGFAAAGLFLFLCLVELGCSRWPALLLAIGLAVLSPQTMRSAMSHYSLATPWVLPAAVWLYLRLRRSTRQLPWALALAALLFVLYRHHGYLAVIVTAWLGIRWCLGLLRRSDRAWRWVLLGALLLPFAMHRLIGAWTDHHRDRTEHPTGFVEYRANWDGVLRPDNLVRSPLSHALLGDLQDLVMEGLSYVGLGNMLLLLTGLTLPLFARRVWRFPKAPGPAPPAAWQEAGWLFLCSLPLAMFAFGLPFEPGRLDWLWNLPLVRQFRAPGRFIWPAWTGLSLFLAAWLTALGRAATGRDRWLATAPLFAAATLFLYEGIYFHRSFSERAMEHPNIFHGDNLPVDMQGLLATIPEGRFRALLPLPYFHNGAEDLMLPVDNESLFAAQVIAYHTGIPMMASSLGRTSLEETRELIGVLAPGHHPYALAKHFRADDQLLVIWTGAELPEEDHNVLDKTAPLASSGTYELRTITAKDLFADRRAAILAKARVERESMHRSGNWWFSTPDTLLIHRTFDDAAPVEHTYRGASAMRCMRKDLTVLAEMKMGTLDTGLNYVATMWVYNRGPMRCHVLFGISELDPVSWQGQWHHYTDGRFARVLDGDWSMIRLPFQSHGKDKMHQLFVTSTPAVDDTLWIDEVIIRREDTHVQRWPTDTSAVGAEVVLDGHFVPLAERE